MPARALGHLMPRVSVVMAVYNGERYVREALESISAQTFEDFEFLVVDDGSRDRTREIVASHADPRVRLIENCENLGLARSLNRALDLVQGEFIARQDADDISEPHRLEKQVARMDADPDMALLGTWYTLIDGRGKCFGHTERPCDSQELRWAMFFHNPFLHSAVMLRRDLVMNGVGGYNEALSYSLDYDLWERIAGSFHVGNLAEYLVRYRLHGASMTSTGGEKTDEGRKIRAAKIGRLLGWEGHELERNERRRSAMTALYFGWEIGADPHRLLQAVDDLLALHEVFCQRERLTPRKATERAVRLRIRIGRNLVLLAKTSSSSDLRQRRDLLLRAYRLHRRVYMKPYTLVRAGRALVRGIRSAAIDPRRDSMVS